MVSTCNTTSTDRSDHLKFLIDTGYIDPVVTYQGLSDKGSLFTDSKRCWNVIQDMSGLWTCFFPGHFSKRRKILVCSPSELLVIMKLQQKTCCILGRLQWLLPWTMSPSATSHAGTGIYYQTGLCCCYQLTIIAEPLKDFSLQKSPHMSDMDNNAEGTSSALPWRPQPAGTEQKWLLNPCGNDLCPSSPTAPLWKLAQSFSFPTTAFPPGLFVGGIPAGSPSSPPQASSFPPAEFYTSASTPAIQRNHQPQNLVKLLHP